MHKKAKYIGTTGFYVHVGEETKTCTQKHQPMQPRARHNTR